MDIFFFLQLTTKDQQLIVIFRLIEIFYYFSECVIKFSESINSLSSKLQQLYYKLIFIFLSLHCLATFFKAWDGLVPATVGYNCPIRIEYLLQ